MELKEYFLIIKRQYKLFLAVVSLVVLGVSGYFFFRPISFETSLFLNVTRSGNQTSEGYKYDDFYRLQADEKFAETIVQWLKSPRIVLDIHSSAGKDMQNLSLKQLAKVFEADKLSSQIVAVKFSTPDEKTAEKIAQAICEILKKNTEKLNEDQKETTWFEIKADSPVIVKSSYVPWIIFIFSLATGMFLGFWIVLGKHYLE